MTDIFTALMAVKLTINHSIVLTILYQPVACVHIKSLKLIHVINFRLLI